MQPEPMNERQSPDASPQCLGDFEILRELGRGGMGVVFEARQVSLNRRVALKVLAGAALTPKAVQRFEREAKAAARLHHTNIVPVYATGAQDGTHFYAMELIEGPSLDRVLRQLRQQATQSSREASPSSAEDRASAEEPLPEWVSNTVDFVPRPAPAGAGDSGSSSGSSSSLESGSAYFDKVAKMVAEVADALKYAHDQGVIHRDIKPSNLLLSQDGRLSINDLGLARVLEQPGMTLTGEFVGTPAYMSPEQITAGRVPLDHRTDIYSLGATLYEMLTLQRPFAAERRDQMLAQIIHKEPRPPRKVNKKIPVDLETICLKAMDKDPDRRYQNAGQMADDLRKYVNRFAISARRAGPLERLWKLVRRHPGVATATACALLLAVTAGYFAHRAYWAEVQRQEDLSAAEAKHREQLRQAALEKALLAAMNGDVATANQAIAEAELLDASTGEIRQLRGMVAMLLGKDEEALEHLKQAVKLLPESVAARALLVNVYYSTLRHDDTFLRAYDEIQTLKPQTLEDYLFLGKLVADEDPEDGLALLNEAAGRRRSLVVLLSRAPVLLLKANDTDDLDALARAQQDIQAVEAGLGSRNAQVLILKLNAALYEYVIRKHLGQADALVVLDRARPTYLALDAFPENFNAFLSQKTYLDLGGRKNEIADLCERRLKVTPANPVLQWFLAADKYRRGRVAEAARDIEKCVQQDDRPDSWTSLGYLWADLYGPDKARKAYEQVVRFADKPHTLAFSIPHAASTVLLMCGRKMEAEQACLKLCQKSPPKCLARFSWYTSRLDYASGKISEAQLLQAAGKYKSNLADGHYTIALHHLADGDRDGAKKHFEAVVAFLQFDGGSFDWSDRFLARMKQDPQWPRWIPRKPA